MWNHLHHTTATIMVYPVGILKDLEKTLLFKHSRSKQSTGHIFQEIHTLSRPLAFKEHNLRNLFCLKSHYKMTVTKSAKCLIYTRHCAEQFFIQYLISFEYQYWEEQIIQSYGEARINAVKGRRTQGSHGILIAGHISELKDQYKL